ncbi:MAG: P-loop NTPase [Mangrovibacterium sp.]
MKIAIASGKGGTGKTFVSTNLFELARMQGRQVSLADCDAEEPNVAEFLRGKETSGSKVFQHVPVIDPEKCTFCGKCFEYCNYNAILFLPDNRFIQVIPDLCHDCGACQAACRDGAITEREKLLGTVKAFRTDEKAWLVESRSEVGVYSPVKIIKQAIREAGRQPLCLMDSPPGISCPFIATVDPADYVVLVTEPTPFGLNDLKLSAETVEQLGKPFGVVINRAGLGSDMVHRWLKEKQIPLLLEIPFDRDIARIYSEGKILVQENPHYRNIFKQLLNSIEAKYSLWQKS